MISCVRRPSDASASCCARRSPSITVSNGDPARRVRLRVEEHLGVDDVLRAGLAEVRHREVVEVLLGAQHAHALVVDGEERGEVVEVVRRPHLLDRRVRQLEAVAGGELELQLGLERALDVQVQLGLRHPLDEARHRASLRIGSSLSSERTERGNQRSPFSGSPRRDSTYAG